MFDESLPNMIGEKEREALLEVKNQTQFFSSPYEYGSYLSRIEDDHDFCWDKDSRLDTAIVGGVRYTRVVSWLEGVTAYAVPTQHTH